MSRRSKLAPGQNWGRIGQNGAAYTTRYIVAILDSFAGSGKPYIEYRSNDNVFHCSKAHFLRWISGTRSFVGPAVLVDREGIPLL